MNVQANARASAAIRTAQSIPVLRASDMCRTDVEVRALQLYATFPNWAPGIAADLEAKARYWRLDGVLSRALATAKATMRRTAHASLPAANTPVFNVTAESSKPSTTQVPRRSGTLTLSKRAMH